MKKKFMRRAIAFAMACVVAAGVFISGSTCQEVQAANYRWKLVKGPVTEPGLEKYSGVTHELKYKVSKAQGLVTHYRKTSYYTDADGWVSGNFVTSYTMPPDVIKAGQKISMKISSSVDNNMKNYIHENYCNVERNNYGGKFYRKSDNSCVGNNLSITTGPDNKLSGTETVYYTIPIGYQDGEIMTIIAETSQGQASGGVLVGGMTTTWTYKWTNLAPKKGVVSKIANVKGAKAKVTVKAVKGAKKYQIRYKVYGAKKWTVVKASTKKTFTINVKKGKKVTVQARVTSAYGTGPWGKSKSLTTDTK